MFWLYSPLTMAMARRMRMNEWRANRCQYAKTKVSTGTMNMQTSANCQFTNSIRIMMATTDTNSANANANSSKVSCNWRMSDCIRDMIRPIGVR